MTRLQSKLIPNSSLILLLSIFIPAAVLAETATNETLIADFSKGVQNRLGGYLNSYECPPSRANARVSKTVFHGDSGRSLRIMALRESDGFCGAWMKFYNHKTLEPKFFDMQNYDVLSFWVKGEKGGETFAVKLADESWCEKEDSSFIGMIEKFLPEGVTTNWQEVLIPLEDQANWLDLENMGGLTFDFSKPGEYTVYIDDISVKTEQP